MMSARIAQRLLRALRRHPDVCAPRNVDYPLPDPKAWAYVEGARFLISCEGKGYEVTVREVELAS